MKALNPNYLTQREFLFVDIFNDGYSDQCEVVPHFSFDLPFSNISDIEHLSCACWPSVCLLWRNVYLGFLCIFFYIELYKLFVYFRN